MQRVRVFFLDAFDHLVYNYLVICQDIISDFEKFDYKPGTLF